MKQFTYMPQGVCSRRVQFDLDDGDIVRNVKFVGGCPGNAKGVAMLAEGQSAKDLIERLSGIDCAGRGTSCPDQFAAALKEAITK